MITVSFKNRGSKLTTSYQSVWGAQTSAQIYKLFARAATLFDHVTRELRDSQKDEGRHVFFFLNPKAYAENTSNLQVTHTLTQSIRL